MNDKGQVRYNGKEIANLPKEFKVNFINSLSGYKSVNLVGTINSNNIANLAIFNSVVHVGSNPPLMGMIIRPPSIKRDTLFNIRESGHFTINHIHRIFFNRAHQTAARYYTEKSEFDIVGLTPYYSEFIKAPYVKESPVKIGLKLMEEHTINSNSTIFIVGEIIEVMCPERAVLSDGLIDLGVTGTITSSGLDTYYTTQKIARLSYAKPDKDLNVIG